MPVVTIADPAKTIEVAEGINLRKVLLRNGISPYRGKDRFLNCLGNGLCGTCRVEVVDGKGAPPMSALEDAALVGLAPFYGRQIPKNVRLSCRIGVSKDLTIRLYPAVTIDWKLTKTRLTLLMIWLLFGGSFLVVMGRLLFEISTGR
jgi:ferredoxin